MERHTRTNIDGEGTPETYAGNSEDPHAVDENSLGPSSKESPRTISQPEPSGIDESPHTTPHSLLSPAPPKPKRTKRKTSEHEELLNILKKRNERRLTERQVLREIDYDETIDSFGQHVKSVLSSLPNLMKIQARTEVYNILTKYEIQAAMQTTTISHSSALELDHMTSVYSSESTPEPADIPDSIEAIPMYTTLNNTTLLPTNQF